MNHLTTTVPNDLPFAPFPRIHPGTEGGASLCQAVTLSHMLGSSGMELHTQPLLFLCMCVFHLHTA